MKTFNTIVNSSIISVLEHLYHQDALRLEDLLSTTPVTKDITKETEQVKMSLKILKTKLEHYRFVIEEEKKYERSA